MIAPAHTTAEELQAFVARIAKAKPAFIPRTWTVIVRAHRAHLSGDLGLSDEAAQDELGKVFATCWMASPGLRERMSKPTALRDHERETEL